MNDQVEIVNTHPTLKHPDRGENLQVTNGLRWMAPRDGSRQPRLQQLCNSRVDNTEHWLDVPTEYEDTSYMEKK